MADQFQVIALHQKYPSLNGPQIAARLGCTSAYVRAAARRNGITLPGARTAYSLQSDSIKALGVAARAAGLTVQRIEELARIGALRT